MADGNFPEAPESPRRVLVLASHAPRLFGRVLPVLSQMRGWDVRTAHFDELPGLHGGSCRDRHGDRPVPAFHSPHAILADAYANAAVALKAAFPDARLVICCSADRRPLAGDATVRERNLRQCDACVCQGWWQLADMPDAVRAKTRVIPDGACGNVFAPDPDACVSLANHPVWRRGEPLITHVADSCDGPAQSRAFWSALARVQRVRRDCQALIIGDRRALEAAAAEGLDLRRIHLIERPLPAQYAQLLRVSAVHVHLAPAHDLLQTLIEAMACGCAVLASGTEPVREVMRDGVTGRLIDAPDAVRVADAMLDMLARPAAHASMRREAEMHASRDFNTTALAARYACLLGNGSADEDGTEWRGPPGEHAVVMLHDYAAAASSCAT
jgi:glycosyltransferase involved in cell wall biosynthesis